MQKIIDKIPSEGLEQEEFNRKYYGNSVKRPVLIKGEVDTWDATQKWTPEYLDCMLGHQEVSINYLEDDVLALNHPEKVEEKTLPFSEARNYICEDGKYYLAQAVIEHPVTTRVLAGANGEFSKLSDDIQQPRFLNDVSKQCFVTNFWFGGDKCKTPLHFDDQENFFAQISGDKRILLFPPSDSEYLYQAHGENFDHLSRINVFDPDVTEFPRYKHAEGSEVIVEPGDMLYIPKGWWHAVETLSTSISVNFWWTGLLRHIRELVSISFERFVPQVGDEKG